MRLADAHLFVRTICAASDAVGTRSGSDLRTDTESETKQPSRGGAGGEDASHSLWPLL